MLVLEVHFDHQLEVPYVIVRARRGVRAHHHLAIDLPAQHHVVPHGESEDVILRRQRKLEPPGVVRQFFALDERTRNFLARIQGDQHFGFLNSRRGSCLAPIITVSFIKLTNVVIFEHLLRLRRVNGIEILGGIHARIHGDAGSTTRMILQEWSAVVHLVVHHNPRRIVVVMLFNLVPLDVLLGRVFLRRSSNGGCRKLGVHLSKFVCIERIHPPALRRSGHSRMFESQLRTVRTRLGMDLDAEVRVVAHAHEIPCQIGRLRVVRFVPRAAHHFARTHCGLEQAQRLDLQRPEYPAIVPAVLGSVREALLGAVDFRELPSLPSVK
mmetsp:Transcript_15616/g.42054  ORF Transcript_15616/g.42054 Transcript_15616/m.42054 type:complete len:325 (+) Transcript_15616:648-1622(+)